MNINNMTIMKKSLLILLALFACINMQAQDEEYDFHELTEAELKEHRDALVAFYKATDGDHWRDNTNWLTDAPIWEWYGVRGGKTGLWSLDFSYNNLKGYIPEEIKGLKSLRNISIREEEGLSGTLPVGISELKWLESLLFYNCNITGAVPEEYSKLTHLDYFVLEGNHINSIPDNLFDKLNKITYLQLADNDLEVLPKSISNLMGKTRGLTEYGYVEDNFISFGNNKLTKLPTEITSHPNWDAVWRSNLDQKPGYVIDFTGVDMPLANFKYTDTKGNKIQYKDYFKKNKHTVVIEIAGAQAGDMELIDDLHAYYEKYHADGLDVIVECLGGFVPDYADWTTIRTFGEENEDVHKGYYFLKTQTTVVDEKGNVIFTVLGPNSDKDSRFGRDRSELLDFIKNIYGPAETPDRSYTSTDYSADGQVITLQTAKEGVGIDVVIMGDCFVDTEIADGTYEKTMKRAMEAFFMTEPMKSLRPLFNVYAVTAVSKNAFYIDGAQTALGVQFGESPYIYGDNDAVKKYALKAVSELRFHESTVIVIAKSRSYYGTCFMIKPDKAKTDYGSGESYCYFANAMDDDNFNYTLVHESVGHGFAKLADEYSQYSGLPSDLYISDIHPFEVSIGYSKNIDVTKDPAKVKWAHFLNDKRYEKEELGVYEGAIGLYNGAYRPSVNSIMRGSDIHMDNPFNAPSREAIWIRAHKLAFGDTWKYNYEEFVAQDMNTSATDIIDVDAKKSSRIGAFDLMGRPVGRGYRGIIVSDGNKYLMK